jgi:hypothetical protein
VHDLPRLVAATPVGTKLDLTIRRGGGQLTVEATIGDMPEKVAKRGAAEPGGGTASALGMELLPLDPELREQTTGAEGGERRGGRPGRERQLGRASWASVRVM